MMIRKKFAVLCLVVVGGIVLSSCANVQAYNQQAQNYPAYYKNKEEREIERMRQNLYYSYDDFLYKAQEIMSQGPKHVK